jgi:hypothetical protein
MKSRARLLSSLVLLAPAAAWLACSSFSSDDTPMSMGDAGGPDALADVASLDAPTDAMPAPLDGGADAGSTIVLVNDHFESAQGCVGWSTQRAVTALSAPGEGLDGGGACQLCSTGSGDLIFQNVQVQGGGFVQALAWIRASPDAAPSGAVTFSGFAADAGNTGSAVGEKTPNGSWQLMQAAAPVDPSTATLFITLSTADTAGCVYIDDVLVTKTPAVSP